MLFDRSALVFGWLADDPRIEGEQGGCRPHIALQRFCHQRFDQARCLLTRRAWPASRTVICSPSSAERSLAKFGLPLGRPLGLPDCPGLNRVALGGLRYPTGYSLGMG